MAEEEAEGNSLPVISFLQSLTEQRVDLLLLCLIIRRLSYIILHLLLHGLLWFNNTGPSFSSSLSPLLCRKHNGACMTHRPPLYRTSKRTTLRGLPAHTHTHCWASRTAIAPKGTKAHYRQLVSLLGQLPCLPLLHHQCPVRHSLPPHLLPFSPAPPPCHELLTRLRPCSEYIYGRTRRK